jgi:hypothetical protein
MKLVHVVKNATDATVGQLTNENEGIFVLVRIFQHEMEDPLQCPLVENPACAKRRTDIGMKTSRIFNPAWKKPISRNFRLTFQRRKKTHMKQIK